MPVIGDGWRRGQSPAVAWQPMPSILRQRLTLLLSSAQLIEVQAEYHRKSLTLLQAVLPQIKAQQGECQAGLGQGGRGACRPPPSAWTHTHTHTHTHTTPAGLRQVCMGVCGGACVTGSPAALLTAGWLPPPPPVRPRHPPKLQEWRCCSWTVLPWTLSDNASMDNASMSTAPCPWDT